MPTGCQHLWTHHKAPGNFTSGKAFESLPHVPSGRSHALKRGRSMSWKMPCKEMVQTGVGPWLGPVTQASPAGSQQCWEQKGPAAAKGCAATSQQDRRQITAMSLYKWQRLLGLAVCHPCHCCHFPGHPHLCHPQPLPQTRHGDTSPTCLKAVLELDEAENEIESLQR